MKNKIFLLIPLLFSNFLNAQYFLQKLSNFSYSTSSNSFAFVDIDNDGDMDAYGVPYADFWINTGTAASPSFTLKPTNFGLNPSASLGVDFIDADNDGDKDAFLVSPFSIDYYKNTGTKFIPFFSYQGNTGFGFVGIGCKGIKFVDIDGDNDLDAALTDPSLGGTFFINYGTVSAPYFVNTSSYGITKGINTQGIDFIDIDGDGDLDAFTNEAAFWKNIGTKFSPSFSLVPQANYGLHSSLGLRFVDIDGDLDLDAFAQWGNQTIGFYEQVSTTGLNEKNDFGVKFVGSNPGDGVFNIEVYSKTNLQVINCLGQKIYESRMEKGVNTINLEDIAPGIYTLQFSDAYIRKEIKYIKY